MQTDTGLVSSVVRTESIQQGATLHNLYEFKQDAQLLRKPTTQNSLSKVTYTGAAFV